MKRALVMLALVATAHAETRPRYAGKIDGSLLGAPAVIDPVAAQSHAELTVAGLVFDTLYRVDLATGAIEPRLAAGMPEPLKDRIRIPLRKGVRFHDGTPMTSADVAASIERARTGAGKWGLAAIATVKADADAIELTLRATTIDVAAMLALAPTAVTKGGKAPGATPIGTGPFELDSIDRAGRRLVLKAFEDHWAGRTYLDRVTLHWYDKTDSEVKQFEVDNLQLSARGAALFSTGQPKYRADSVPGPKSLMVYVGFGRRHLEVLRDTAFRRALDLALERAGVASVNKGEPIVPAGDPVRVDTPSQVVQLGDPTAAKAALADAAKRVPALAPAAIGQLVLEIAFEDTRPDDREIAERVSRALGKLGIGVSLVPLSASELRDRVARGTVDLYIGQLVAPLQLTWAWLAASYAAGGDDATASKIALGQLSVDAARKEFASRLPIVPLVFRGIRMWHRSDLRGLRFDAMGRPCLEDVFVFGYPSKSGTP